MPEMRDAHVGGFVDEDRVAVPLRPAAPVADIGGNVAHAHILDRNVVARRLVGARPPAAQHVLDARIGVISEMAGMRMVHRDDVGQHRRAHIVVVVGRDAHELRTLDQEGRMADIGEPHLIGIERKPERGGNDARSARGHEPGAVLHHLRLRRGRLHALECRERGRGKRQEGGGRDHSSKNSR
jgi:hypothetical protein